MDITKILESDDNGNDPDDGNEPEDEEDYDDIGNIISSVKDSEAGDLIMMASELENIF